MSHTVSVVEALMLCDPFTIYYEIIIAYHSIKRARLNYLPASPWATNGTRCWITSFISTCL